VTSRKARVWKPAVLGPDWFCEDQQDLLDLVAEMDEVTKEESDEPAGHLD
jgi:hypothetical protein